MFFSCVSHEYNKETQSLQNFIREGWVIKFPLGERGNNRVPRGTYFHLQKMYIGHGLRKYLIENHVIIKRPNDI